MRILIDGRLYGLENAGLGRYLINLIGELSKLDTKDEYVLLLRRKYFEDLRLPSNWKKVLADFGHYSFAEQIKLPGIIKSENPDIVHFPHFNVPVFYCGKYLVTIHDTLMHRNIGREATTLTTPVYFIKRLAYKFVFGKAVRSSNAIITPSISVKDELVNYYKISGSKVFVTHEGFDERITTEGGVSIKKPYFIYVGNAYPHKNLSRLLEAILQLNKNFDQECLLVVVSSRNIFTHRLQRVVDKLNAGEFVKLLGFVPDNKLGALLKNSLAFVFPSLSEGFGLPGLEAMNTGTLLLASDIPVFKEIYNKNAIYFNPLDFNSIEQSMKNVLEMDKETREERIEKAKEFVKRYSWAKMAKETLKIYFNVSTNAR